MTVELDQDFDAFYTATHRRIIAQIYAMTGALHETEDCVQEAYARAWQRWAKLSAEHGNPEAWVRTVASRLAVSSWRKAVNRLKAHHRADQTTAVPGMDANHLAIGASQSTVKARLSRGRKALAPHLAEFAESLEKPRPLRASDQPQVNRRGI